MELATNYSNGFVWLCFMVASNHIKANLECGEIKKKLIELSGTFHVIHVRTGLTANYPIDSFHLDKHGIALSTKNQHALVIFGGHPW